MVKMNLLRLVLVAMLVTIAFLPLPVAQGSESPTTIVSGYYNSVTVNSVNLSNNTATIAIHLTIIGVGNWSCCTNVWISWYGSPIGFLRLAPIGRGNNSTTLANMKNNSAFNIPIKGSPSFYPIDSYIIPLNFTFVNFPSNWVFANNTQRVTASPLVESQFNTPVGLSERWQASSMGKVDVMTIQLSRRDWVAWATLGPIILIYLIIGFLSLLPRGSDKLYPRLSIQLFIFIILLGYYITIAPSLPPTTIYLPLVQVLTYAGLTAVTIFVVLSILVEASSLSRSIGDSVAVIFSLMAFDFFVFTMLFSNQLVDFTFWRIVILQWGVMVFFASGTIYYALRWARGGGRRAFMKALYPPVLGSPPTSVVNWLYATAAAFNLGALLLTNYLVQVISPNIEQTPFRKLLFQYTVGNFFVSGISNLFISIFLVLGAYLILRKRSVILWSSFGILLFIVSALDFINDSVLFPEPSIPLFFIYVIPTGLVAAWALGLLLARRRTKISTRLNIPP